MRTLFMYRLCLVLIFGAITGMAEAGMKSDDISAARALFTNNGCASCHDISERSSGPSMRDIAKRYQGKKVNAEMAQRIREGSIGRWGDAEAHPPIGVLEPREARLLADWILNAAP